MNELDGEWYEERNPVNLARSIDIPVYLQIDQGRGWTVDGHIELFETLSGPKKLDIGSYPPMQSRPWVEEHDTMFRWYEYWLKGIDNGIMDEPAVSVFVEGSREVVTADQWPPKDIGYRSLYLRPRGKLSFRPEAMGAEHAPPDGFYQAPLTVTDTVQVLDWSTAAFEEPTELIGTGAAHLFVEIDQEDTNLILRLWDARAERVAAAAHQRLPQGLAPRARRGAHVPRATPTTRTPGRCPWCRAPSRSTSSGSTRSRRPSCRAIDSSSSSRTTSRSPTPTTPSCRPTPSTSRWVDR